MTNKNLEEIFWEDGRWKDSENSEVNPFPIGPSQVVSSVTWVKSLEDPEYVADRKKAGYEVAESDIYSVPANDEQLKDYMGKKISELIRLNPNEKEYAKINAYSKGKYGSAILSNDGAIVQFYKI